MAQDWRSNAIFGHFFDLTPKPLSTVSTVANATPNRLRLHDVTATAHGLHRPRRYPKVVEKNEKE